MGIVNVTPDSFSDGGEFLDPKRAVAHGLSLAEQGAAILDVGGESTRPNATPVEETEELRRVIEVVRLLAEQTRVPISIDTSKAKVAAEAIAAGAEIVNDVSGLERDSRMIDVATESGAGVCVMHMQGTPRTMQENPLYADVVEDVAAYLRGRYEALVKAGIDASRVCLDPGIGFGKTHQHNLTLLAAVSRYHSLGVPLLVGHSRKGFLAKILASKTADRTAASVGVSLALARAGVQVIRVHDVLPTVQALTSFAAVGGIDQRELQLEDVKKMRSK
jgi:dihydropteroate synthase